MHPVVASLTRFLDHQDIRSGVMLVGVSGGADSVALLRGLALLRESRSLTLRVIHVDHGLRDSSGNDALWVDHLCQQLHVPCQIFELNLRRNCPQSHVSEETARTARIEAFKKGTREVQANWLSTAHTADDQAETVLHHILRGSSWRGLRGIPVRRPLFSRNELSVDVESPYEGAEEVPLSTELIRPFLDITRAQIVDWLHVLGQESRDDETNRDPRYTRNRLRSSLIPQLHSEYGVQVSEALRRMSRQSCEMLEFVQRHAADLLTAALLEQTPDMVRLKLAAFQESSRFLVKEACVLLWERQAWPRQNMTARHWEELAEIILGKVKRRETLPGKIDAERRRELLTFTRRA